MNRSELVSRARRGDADAIAQLIGSALVSQNISVQAEWQGDHLQILLEGSTLPSPNALVPTLRQGFERLAVRRAIASVRLYACHPDQDSPDWVETFTLSPILDSPLPTSLSAPAEPASARSVTAPYPADLPVSTSAASPTAPAPDRTVPEPPGGRFSSPEMVSPESISSEPISSKPTSPKPNSPEPNSPEPITPAPSVSAESVAPKTFTSAPPASAESVAPEPVAANSAAPEPPDPIPYTPPPSPPPPYSFPTPPSSADPYFSDTALVILVHLAPLLGYLAWLPTALIGLPFLGSGTFLLPFRIIAPLALLLTKGKASSFIRSQSQEALNFQISLTLYWLVTFALMFLLVGFLLVIPLAFFEGVCIIVAAVKASDGKPFRYPLTLRFVR